MFFRNDNMGLSRPKEICWTWENFDCSKKKMNKYDSPWTRYPCHTCAKSREPEEHKFPRHTLLKSNGNIRIEYNGGYAWADGYYWCSAGWNKTTGEWYAKCCDGHVIRGKKKVADGDNL